MNLDAERNNAPARWGGLYFTHGQPCTFRPHVRCSPACGTLSYGPPVVR